MRGRGPPAPVETSNWAPNTSIPLIPLLWATPTSLPTQLLWRWRQIPGCLAIPCLSTVLRDWAKPIFSPLSHRNRQDLSRKSRFVKGEEFTNELINAISEQTTQGVSRKYRSADVLHMDDVQFIGGKKAHRRSFSTPLTLCTRKENRSSSPPTGRPKKSKPWRKGCAPALSGAFWPMCSPPILKPEPPSSTARRSKSALRCPPKWRNTLPIASKPTSASWKGPSKS